MSIYGIPHGVALTEPTVLTDTSATTVLDGTNRDFRVVGILLVNDTGGALTPIVDLYDGTNSYVLRDNTSLADQGREVLALPDFIHLRKGWLLRVTAGANLNVFVSYIDNAVQRSSV